MKKLLPYLLLLLLLLAACHGQDDGNKTSTPPPPTPTAAATPTPVQDLVWDVNFGLEDIYLDQLPTLPGIAQGDVLTYPHYDLLAQLPDQALFLYGIILKDSEGILLRKGPMLQYFEQSYTAGGQTLPDLYWADFDGDDTRELAVRSLEIRGESHAFYHLHIYTWQDERWTDHPFVLDEVAGDLGQPTDLFFQIDGSDITATFGFSNQSSRSAPVEFDGDTFTLGSFFDITDHIVV